VAAARSELDHRRLGLGTFVTLERMTFLRIVIRSICLFGNDLLRKPVTHFSGSCTKKFLGRTPSRIRPTCSKWRLRAWIC